MSLEAEGPASFAMKSSDHNSMLVKRTEAARLEANRVLDSGNRSTLGQFMTPAPIAGFMASMFDLETAHVRLLDAGAGVGSLTVAFVEEACRRDSPPASIEATAFEVEPMMLTHLGSVLRSCEQKAARAGVRFTGHVSNLDFIKSAASILDDGLYGKNAGPRFNAAILNPPYCKINSRSPERTLLREVGIETSNLYTAFVALAIKLLEPGGELVAITPRSFCNGPYFRSFRQLLLREMALLRIHVFEARDTAFEDDDVLQENVILHAKKGAQRGMVVLSSSVAADSEGSRRAVPHDTVVDPQDTNAFIHLALSDEDDAAASSIQALPCKLEDVGIQVSTGRVVEFRAREHLRKDPGQNSVPLIYPAHFDGGFVSWPRLKGRKPNALAHVGQTEGLMVPNATYVLTKRFTTKEERRRVVAAVYDPSRLPPEVDHVGFENHINYFHVNGGGMPKRVACGLAVFLNSSLVDCYFRQFNGHTQVNAVDLRSLRYPKMEQLKAMGRKIGKSFPDQNRVDEIVNEALDQARKDSAR